VIGFAQVSLGILAGGQGRRLGWVDKSAQTYEGSSLLQRTLRAFPEAYAERLLSYNLAPDERHAGLRCVADLRGDFPGPLAGLETLLQACRSDWLLTVPVDCRRIPEGLADALLSRLAGNGVVVRDADGLQPLLGLWRVDITRVAVQSAFSSVPHSVRGVLAGLRCSELDIAPWRLGNLNTPDEFQQH
jgi:molybdopterin-guanine dinucleotide biosynthesis protein A